MDGWKNIIIKLYSFIYIFIYKKEEKREINIYIIPFDTTLSEIKALNLPLTCKQYKTHANSIILRGLSAQPR